MLQKNTLLSYKMHTYDSDVNKNKHIHYMYRHVEYNKHIRMDNIIFCYPFTFLFKPSTSTWFRCDRLWQNNNNNRTKTSPTCDVFISFHKMNCLLCDCYVIYIDPLLHVDVLMLPLNISIWFTMIKYSMLCAN